MKPLVFHNRPILPWRASVASVTTTLFLAAVLAATATADDPPEALDLAIEIRDKANADSLLSQQKIDRLADETDTTIAEYRRVLEQVKSLRVYNVQLNRLLTRQKEDIDSLGEQIEQVALVGRQLSPLMLRMIDSLESFVELDIPFLADERANRVASLRAMMDRADVTDSEKYRRVLEAYQVENEYGRTLEAYRGTLSLGDTERTVDFLRVGRLALLYRSLDGKLTGAWDRDTGAWTDLDGDYGAAIRKGLAVAREQTAPALLELPLPAATPLPTARQPAGSGGDQS